VITSLFGMELSRATVIAMARADAQDRAEEKARREAAEARREEIVARAQAYYHEHGEWEWQTRERELDARNGGRRLLSGIRRMWRTCWRRASGPGRLARFSLLPCCIPEAPDSPAASPTHPVSGATDEPRPAASKSRLRLPSVRWFPRRGRANGDERLLSSISRCRAAYGAPREPSRGRPATARPLAVVGLPGPQRRP
jgi:hypothetical protein